MTKLLGFHRQLYLKENTSNISHNVAKKITTYNEKSNEMKIKFESDYINQNKLYFFFIILNLQKF